MSSLDCLIIHVCKSQKMYNWVVYRKFTHILKANEALRQLDRPLNTLGLLGTFCCTYSIKTTLKSRVIHIYLIKAKTYEVKSHTTLKQALYF
ncbi:hypothetical protein GDO86_010201 [Hymenochirus boettgeri]|uniref:Uncharacterized protein n=1 Tax=Hymenochirus boettgeri TaxID=247094 RepID=A0A8T2JJH9_9PIPI|nr:hypothetical protein GDO86_010201 [Hymenochirus boettgeri]